MRRFLARFSDSEASNHTPSWADFTTTTPVFEFSVHTPPSFCHVLGDARLRDLQPELEQFAVNARRAPKWVLDTHPPDQYAQLRIDLRSPSLWARLPTPIAAKAGPVPTHERLGPDDCENLQD